MDLILEYLKQIIPISQHKNKSIYTSYVCPFTGYVSKRKSKILRYNQKLGVVKCFDCGCSAKELYWLKLQIENPKKWELKNLYTEKFRYGLDRIKYIEFKLSELHRKENVDSKNDGITKIDEDLNEPF